jgi:hypothetical protein
MGQKTLHQNLISVTKGVALLTKFSQNEFVVVDDRVKIAVREDPHVFLLLNLLVGLCQSNHQQDQGQGEFHGAWAEDGAMSAVRGSGGGGNR